MTTCTIKIPDLNLRAVPAPHPRGCHGCFLFEEVYPNTSLQVTEVLCHEAAPEGYDKTGRTYCTTNEIIWVKEG